MGKKFLTITQTVKLLPVSVATLHRMISSGELPSYKVGKRRFFDQQEVIAWVKKRKCFETKDLGKKITMLEEALTDDKMLKDMPYDQKMKLYTLLNRSMNRRIRHMQTGISNLFESTRLPDYKKKKTPSSPPPPSGQEPGSIKPEEK